MDNREERPPSDWRAWDATWSPASGNPRPGLDHDTLENHIDAGKLRFLGVELPRKGRALEVGCGSARLLARVGRDVPLELVALDPAPQALALAAATARDTGVTMTPMRGDALALPYADASFELVLSGGLLEHFAEPEPVLAEMVRVLEPGGTFYADVVPRKLSLYRVREAFRMLRNPWLMPGVYESPHGPDRYRAALERLDCEHVRVRWAGVYLPRANRAVAEQMARLDGTPIAAALGWYFMIAARRRRIHR
jgi:SAM-dependent methyltransferase